MGILGTGNFLISVHNLLVKRICKKIKSSLIILIVIVLHLQLMLKRVMSGNAHLCSLAPRHHRNTTAMAATALHLIAREIDTMTS